MNSLERLKKVEDLNDFSKLLGFTPKGMSYVLYKLPDEKKYRTFEIPKKTGGTRTIKAPEPQLALMQSHLAELLYSCASELMREKKTFWRASHGFQKKRTIVSNAEVHRRRRFVFNIDLEDFFGTINFGRVRGFFISDKSFGLDPAVATLIAQIACHENALPQGSPCSPIISNFIGNILDSRLLALARNARCTYTRYADDLTFSTNEKLFPTEIAVNTHSADWEVGKALRKSIESSGFKINNTKTRMSLRRSRQVVTGLVVNAKPNINQDYYRSTRSMCNAVFQTGVYYRPDDDDKEPISNLNPLEGRLSYIHFVKARRDRSQKTNKKAREAGEFSPPKAPAELYRKLLFYKHFVAPSKAVIVTEGISDITYLQCAIRSLAKSFPRLVQEVDGKTELLVRFLRPTGTSRDILNLGHGASGQTSLISGYPNNLKKYKHKPLDHPIIILCDNDSGPKKVFAEAKKKCGKDVSTKTNDPYYYLGDNLYLIKVPEGSPAKDREIEDLFDPALLKTKLDGKPFDRKKDHGDDTAYGKVVFAEKVVRAGTKTIDFTGFNDLLERVDQVMTHYATVKAGTPAPVAAAATSP